MPSPALHPLASLNSEKKVVGFLLKKSPLVGQVLDPPVTRPKLIKKSLMPQLYHLVLIYGWSVCHFSELKLLYKVF